MKAGRTERGLASGDRGRRACWEEGSWSQGTEKAGLLGEFPMATVAQSGCLQQGSQVGPMGKALMPN